MRNITLAAAIAGLVSATANTTLMTVAQGMATGERLATLHAEGAQIYECQADAAGFLAWKFREPVATLMHGGATIGRHYAGPSWELSDGTFLRAKVVAKAPGPTPADIPELMLTVQNHRGPGQIATAKTIVRTNTKGGVAEGACTLAGGLLSVPYSADYEFFDAGRIN